jgi:thiol-disulfide isomerase/thioredoxin
VKFCLAVAVLLLPLIAGADDRPADDEMRAYQEIRALAADRLKYGEKLREFIARPEHKHPEILGSAYMQLFRLDATDPQSNAKELVEVIRGMDRYETSNPHIKYAMAAETLADRGIELAYAEDLARRGIPAMAKYMEEGRADYGTNYDRNAKFFNAQMHDALGWVLIREGKRREGETALKAAYRLNAEDPHVLYHLGRLAEQKHDAAAAERWYARGAIVQTSRTNPNAGALEAVYQERHGSLAGFGAYLARLRDADTRTRRRRVLAARLSPPRAVPRFELTTLDGAKVSLDSLRGKLVVVNFWGLWCGWCLREMPDVAEVWKRYRSNPRVAVLTIDTNDDPAKVRRWMSEQRYEFPVLLDTAKYAPGAGIRTYPTTWFLDAEGRLAFEKVGFSYKLAEEFAWRIDELLDESGLSFTYGKVLHK